MDTVLSILMLAALAMLAGAFWLWRRQGAIRQVWLMIVLALIMLLNVAIWTIPDKGGTAPVDRAAGPPE
jgi:drug/metabolite transporter superfamily protein YnfA